MSSQESKKGESQSLIVNKTQSLIMISLYKGPKCVCAIAEDLDMHVDTISKNLKKMEGKDPLVSHTRYANTKTFQLNRSGVALYKYLSSFHSGFKDWIADYKRKKNQNDSNNT